VHTTSRRKRRTTIGRLSRRYDKRRDWRRCRVGHHVLHRLVTFFARVLGRISKWTC